MPAIGNHIDEFPVKGDVTIGDLDTLSDCDNAAAWLTLRLGELDVKKAELRQPYEQTGILTDQVVYSRVRSEHHQVRTALRLVYERRRAIASRESIDLTSEEGEVRQAVAIVRTIRETNNQVFIMWRDRAKVKHPEAFA